MAKKANEPATAPNAPTSPPPAAVGVPMEDPAPAVAPEPVATLAPMPERTYVSVPAQIRPTLSDARSASGTSSP
ncbi:MAG TPA: dihydrolipoamide succinyltransferase, partial [Thermoplasmata archaeon]|nr:dihydrolipoamide succinyltransferase [Thermoplasmata archaeon]